MPKHELIIKWPVISVVWINGRLTKQIIRCIVAVENDINCSLKRSFWQIRMHRLVLKCLCQAQSWNNQTEMNFVWNPMTLNWKQTMAKLIFYLLSLSRFVAFHTLVTFVWYEHMTLARAFELRPLFVAMMPIRVRFLFGRYNFWSLFIQDVSVRLPLNVLFTFDSRWIRNSFIKTLYKNESGSIFFCCWIWWSNFIQRRVTLTRITIFKKLHLYSEWILWMTPLSAGWINISNNGPIWAEIDIRVI